MEPCEHEPSNGAYGDWIFKIHLELMGPFYQPFLCITTIYLFRKRIKINKHIIINLWPEEKELKKNRASNTEQALKTHHLQV